MKHTLCLLCLAAVALAQTTTPAASSGTTTTTASSTTASSTVAAATAATTPSQWFVGTGIEYNPYYNSPLFAQVSPILPAVHLGGCWTTFCEISTLEFQNTTATVRQDFGYKMRSTADGSAMLIAIAGGALTTTTVATNSVLPSSLTLGSVGGGFAVKVDPGIIPFLKAIKGKGLSFLGEVRIAQQTAQSSNAVAPQFSFWVDYRFK